MQVCDIGNLGLGCVDSNESVRYGPSLSNFCVHSLVDGGELRHRYDASSDARLIGTDAYWQPRASQLTDSLNNAWQHLPLFRALDEIFGVPVDYTITIKQNSANIFEQCANVLDSVATQHTSSFPGRSKTEMLRRCEWCGSHPLYQRYHDTEWGVPERCSAALFERLILEGMQAGLSWWTVLQKRAHMRSVFFNFKPERLAEASDRLVDDWLCDAGIIRHRGKLVAMIGNAQAFLQIKDFSGFVWSVVADRPLQNRYDKRAKVPSQTEESVGLAKKLAKAGFRFVGPTTVYALMQSAGLVNDHMIDCHRHEVCRALGAATR